MEFSHEKRNKLHSLFYQLSELIKSLPTILDFYDWVGRVDYIMQEIRDLSDRAYERLNDLVLELERIAEKHVEDLDEDVSPRVAASSAEKYFQQVSYVISEINQLKGE